MRCDLALRVAGRSRSSIVCDAQHGVADEQRAVRRRRLRAQLLDVVRERRKAEPAALVVEQIERRRHRRASCRCGAGASEMPQLPATTVVTPWLTLGAMSRRREHQAVVVGVRVDEAGRDDRARGIDLASAASPSSGPMRAMRPPLTAMSASIARRARAVDDGAVADTARSYAHQSTLAPERFTTSAHFGVSLRTSARNSSGVPPSGSVSSCLKRSMHGRRRERLADLGVQPGDDLRGRFAGADDPAPGDGLVAGTPASASVGRSGNARRALRPARPPMPRTRPACACGADRRDVVEHQLDFAGDQVVDRLRAAAIGHVQDVGAGHRLEQLAAEVAGGAVAAGGHYQLAGILLRVVDQLLHRVHRQLVVHREHVEHPHAVRHQREVLLDVVGHAWRAASG